MFTIPASLGLLFYCPNADFDQVGDVLMEPKDFQNCNQNCVCDLDFQPICSDQNVIYYNPCIAGCTGKETNEQNR